MNRRQKKKFYKKLMCRSYERCKYYKENKYMLVMVCDSARGDYFMRCTISPNIMENKNKRRYSMNILQSGYQTLVLDSLPQFMGESQHPTCDARSDEMIHKINSTCEKIATIMEGKI